MQLLGLKEDEIRERIMKKNTKSSKTVIVVKTIIVATFLPNINDTIVILAANVIQVFWSLKDFVSKVIAGATYFRINSIYHFL